MAYFNHVCLWGFGCGNRIYLLFLCNEAKGSEFTGV